MVWRMVCQPVACTIGMHIPPAPRVPHGPIVASCPCCHKTVYYYGLAAYGLSTQFELVLPSFPRVLGIAPPSYA